MPDATRDEHSPTVAAALAEAVDGVLCSWEHHHRTIRYLEREGLIELSHRERAGRVYRATPDGIEKHRELAPRRS